MKKNNSPTCELIKLTRKSHKLNTKKAAELIHCSGRSWEKWEGGKREMHPAFWELFLIKVKKSE